MISFGEQNNTIYQDQHEQNTANQLTPINTSNDPDPQSLDPTKEEQTIEINQIATSDQYFQSRIANDSVQVSGACAAHLADLPLRIVRKKLILQQ